MTKSDITGKWYHDEDCVFFRNYVQAAHYIAWGGELIDLFTDSQTKLVFVFTKETHNCLKSRWGTKENNGDKNNEESR